MWKILIFREPLINWMSRKERLLNTERVLAIELFNAAQALDFRRPARSSATIEQMVAEYRKRVPFIDNDSVMYPHIESSIQFLRTL